MRDEAVFLLRVEEVRYAYSVSSLKYNCYQRKFVRVVATAPRTLA